MDCVSVLVADGDSTFSAAVAALVEQAGLTAHTAATSDEALASARDSRPDVVVLDVGLTNLSGYETCRKLREMFGETLPILFVSAERTEPNDRVAGLLVGADDYLAKPVDQGELLARILRSATRSAARTSEPAIRVRSTSATPPSAREGAMGLTARELEVLRLIALGRTPGEISEQLVISPRPSEPPPTHADQDGRAQPAAGGCPCLRARPRLAGRARRGAAATIERRRGWDSNPRRSCPLNSFQDCPIRPLSHPAAPRQSRGGRQPLTRSGAP